MTTFASTAAKLVTLDEAVAWRRSRKGAVVFTNGVFDLLHPGHVESIEAARAFGDALVVAVNSDPSAARLEKGPGRPVMPAADRARMVASLAAVDRVVVFGDPTPLAVIEALHPDVLVKGGDYSPDTIVGADLVREWGGRVAVIPLLEGYSTSSLLERIRGPR